MRFGIVRTFAILAKKNEKVMAFQDCSVNGTCTSKNPGFLILVFANVNGPTMTNVECELSFRMFIPKAILREKTT